MLTYELHHRSQGTAERPRTAYSPVLQTVKHAKQIGNISSLEAVVLKARCPQPAAAAGKLLEMHSQPRPRPAELEIEDGARHSVLTSPQVIRMHATVYEPTR